MILINPQPETEPESNMKELGFTRRAFTGLLISRGLLSAGETVFHWELERDFLAFDVKEKL